MNKGCSMHSQNSVPDTIKFVNKMLYGLNASVPCGSGPPGHQTGVEQELDSPEGVVCSRSRSK